MPRPPGRDSCCRCGGGAARLQGVEVALHEIEEFGCYHVALSSSGTVATIIMIAVASRRS